MALQSHHFGIVIPSLCGRPGRGVLHPLPASVRPVAPGPACMTKP